MQNGKLNVSVVSLFFVAAILGGMVLALAFPVEQSAPAIIELVNGVVLAVVLSTLIIVVIPVIAVAARKLILLTRRDTKM